METGPAVDDLIDLLPGGPAAHVKTILAKGGWLFGSTIRKLMVGEPVEDLDMMLCGRAAAFYFNRLAKTSIAGHLWAIDGWKFHVCHKIDFMIGPMFDVDMLGLSKNGVAVRPLSPCELRFSYDVPAILAKIKRKEFSIYPSHERSFYYEKKLANLLAAGWRQT